jgi:hypothetical protein
VDDLLDLAEAIITEQWPCFCSDSHLRSHFYIAECPRHTLGPALIVTLTEAAKAGGVR